MGDGSGVELWTTLLEHPARIVDLAAEREAQGWDGLAVADTQYYLPDPYVALTAVAMRTRRVLLSPSTTNPVTRHPSVTAAAIGTLQVVSEGRAVLGIGRGDSSAFYAGEAPATGARFEAALRMMRALLDGDPVELPTPPGNVTSQHHETRAALRWLPPHVEPVPIDVYGSGPRTMRLAAQLAERLTVAIGAEPRRLRAARERLDAVASANGRRAPRLGAVLLIAPHPDRQVARRLISGFAASHARFAAMGGKATGVDAADRAQYEAAATGYDMAKHGDSSSGATGALSQDFIDRFTVCGPAEECARRVVELVGIGLERVLLMPPGIDNPPDERELSVRLLGDTVLPRIRELLAARA